MERLPLHQPNPRHTALSCDTPSPVAVEVAEMVPTTLNPTQLKGSNWSAVAVTDINGHGAIDFLFAESLCSPYDYRNGPELNVDYMCRTI